MDSLFLQEGKQGVQRFLFDLVFLDDVYKDVWQAQKQMHFDFQVDDLPTAVIQAEAIGAVKAASKYGGDDFVTMFDPEDHPFCLCAK